MKSKIVNFSFNRIRKSEIPEIMNAILTIVEKHNPEALFIVGMYNLLLELRPLLDILTVRYDGYPNSKELLNQRSLRDKLLGAILSHKAAVEKARIASLVQPASLAVPFLQRYLNGILAENEPVKSGKVNQVLTNLKDNTELTTALENLGFTVYMNELKTCQLTINVAESQRRETLSLRGNFNTTDARAKIAFATSNLLNAIELAKVEHTDIDYMPLINELHVLLNSKQTIVKSRITRCKNSAAIKTMTVASSTTTTATAI